MAIVGKAFRKCLPEDKNSCVNCDNYLTCPLAEYFTGSTGTKDQFSYGLFWDTVTDDSPGSIKIMVDYMPKDEGSFYYEYGLLKAEEEMEAEHPITEKLISSIDGRKLYSYNIRYENPGEKQVSFYFYTRTRIMAFIQHENEVMNLAAEMQEITQQKPILCLESHTRLFRGALDSIMEAYSKGEYSDEDLRKEYCYGCYRGLHGLDAV